MRHTRLDTLALALLPVLPVQEQELDLSPLETHLPDQAVVVPLDLSTGHPIVQVEIDGLGPFPMIFDTGASGTVLDQDLAEELGLPVTGETVAGDPSDPTALKLDLVVMPTLALGAARFEEITAVSWNRPAQLGGGATRGILGLPTFEDCLFTLDYAKKELRLSRGKLPAPEDDANVVAFHRRDNGLVSVPLGLPGGFVVDAHLDSGNMSTVFVPASYESKLEIVEGSKRTGSGSRASGTVEFVYARIAGDLTVGPLTLRDPELRLDPVMPHANIGRSFFEAAEVTVDLAQKRMRIRPRAPDGIHVEELVRQRSPQPKRTPTDDH